MPPMIRHLLFFFAQMALGTVIPVVASGSLPVSDDYILRTWSIDDGLPSNRVTGITQTPDGYLWVATLGGVTRFDGVRFTTFYSEVTPGLELDRAWSVFVARDGSLWVGLDRGGVVRRIGDRFQTIVPVVQGTKPAGWTTSFAQDASGAIWFGYESPNKVFRWETGRLSEFSGREGLAIGRGGSHETEVCATVNGTVWYANTDGCGPFDGKRFQSIDPDGGMFIHLVAAADGGMWAIRGPRLVHYRADGTWETEADLSALSVHVLMEDRAGNVWIGTNNAGLVRFRDGRLTSVPVGEASVSALFEDREGDIWVGTRSGGVTRLHTRRFYLRQTKDGLLDNDTYSLCEDSEQRLWLAGHNSMLVRATDASNRSFAIPQGRGDWTGTMTVKPDPAGGVWVGTLHGLLHSREKDFSYESVRLPVTSLLTDRSGDLWVGTIGGPLVRHRDGQDVRMSEEDGLTHVLALAEDVQGRLWAGTEDGLVFKKSGGQFAQVPLPGANHREAIQFIVPDGPDTVWIGALNGGLYRWRSGAVKRMPHGAGLTLNDLRSLIITPEGDFWMGTERGLFRVTRSEVEAVLDGRQTSLHCDSYGRDDGLPSIEFSVGFRGATNRTEDGHLWFATARGALEIVPKKKAASVAPLPVLIEDVRVGDNDTALVGVSKLMIPPRSGPLQIRYTLPQLSAPERLRFRYRLLGPGDNRWVDVGAQRSVSFPRLQPGAYFFEVAAGEADHPWVSSTITALAFVVQAAWWETLLFRVGVGLAGALALVWTVRKIVLLRVNARIRKLEQEHALERERTRIARDIHDQLGANLTRIAITSKLLTLDPPEAVPAHSRELTSIARQTAESLDEIVWAVNPHYDNLAALVDYLGMFAVDFLSSAKIACEIDAPTDLPARPLSSNVRHHLFLAVKESLNNVVKHAGAGVVHLHVRQEGGVLNVVVADDGHGFDPGSEPTGSNGIRNLGERMKEIGGEFQIESVRGKGTRVVLKLPLPEAGS